MSTAPATSTSLGGITLDLLILLSDLCIAAAFFCYMRADRQTASAQSYVATLLGRVLHLTFTHAQGLHYQPLWLPWMLFFAVDVLAVGIGIVGLVKDEIGVFGGSNR